MAMSEITAYRLRLPRSIKARPRDVVPDHVRLTEYRDSCLELSTYRRRPNANESTRTQ